MRLRRPLRLAADAELHVNRVDQGKTQIDKRGRLAGFELELDFMSRLAPLAGEQEPLIERDLDCRAVDIDRSGRPANVGAEFRRERLLADDLFDLSRDRLIEQGKIRFRRRRFHFQFIAVEEAAVRSRSPLQTHDIGAVRLPHAQRDATDASGRRPRCRSRRF